MIPGPIFYREFATAPRKPKLFLNRAAYAGGFLILISTAWALLTGMQIINSVGDTARFGLILFHRLAPLQLAVIVFYSAITCAAAVSQEKDRRTLVLLLLTRLSNGELVLGKLFASLLHSFVLLAAALPIFMLVVMFGGISSAQVVRVYSVTFVATMAAGSLGTVVALWREKTFQTLAIVVLTLFVWIGFWEVVYGGAFGSQWLGYSTERIATAFEPFRAVAVASRPVFEVGSNWLDAWRGVAPFLVGCSSLALVMCGIAIWRVRVWNPSRQIRQASADDETAASIWNAGEASTHAAERAREGHVDAKLRSAAGNRQSSRRVWDNPILWREICTWAYGRKIVFVRIIYAVVAVAIAFGLYRSTASLDAAAWSEDAALIPIPAWLIGVLTLVSLVILNAMAVTSVSTERDGRSLDLLLATDLSPKEFVFGKLFGVLSVAGLMVVTPMLLTIYLWNRGGLSNENLVFMIGGLLVMNAFVAMLGLHCGTRYANSRTAIGVSLGTVFFLFLGVVACLMMMVSFSGSFQVQLAPFLAFILGGGVGLYAALGAGNPSKAIAAASMVVPFATFYSITSFLLRHNLAVFLVSATAYGFATAAMLIPSLYEFDFAMGRTSVAEE